MYRNLGLESFDIRLIPVILPKHKDPDEFLKKETPADYLELLKEAKSRVEEIGVLKYCYRLASMNKKIEID